ncbi:Hypothetical predicted protein [Prunus dulcis]|uniref:Uncharacterized protein n=1 Tax=Prunus dulcis TaxID=3755 RepID=A0A5E4GBL5_PRUDU|nr:hypothetical protein L3X38_033293 [Prunus dulcis]VVA36978.1 Hypothetical predicted protein [Prunus dulcis]
MVPSVPILDQRTSHLLLALAMTLPSQYQRPSHPDSPSSMPISVSPPPLSVSLPNLAQPQPHRRRTLPLIFLFVSIYLCFYVGLAIRGGDLHVVEEIVGLGS